MRKIIRDSDKTTLDISLYERLVSHLEGQILYLEDEVKKKDILIEKLIDRNLDHSNKSKSKMYFLLCVYFEKFKLKSKLETTYGLKSEVLCVC